MSAFKAGLLVMALFAGNIAIKPLTTPLMRRFGIRRVLVGNGVLSVVCFGALVLISLTTPDVVIAVALFVSGALRSIGFTAYNSLAFADVDSGELTDANTLHATLQELASGLGIALSALVITLCTPLAESGDPSGGVPFSLTLGVLGAMLVPTVIESWRLPRDTGAVVLVRR
jgi:MFS family permease